MSSVESKKPLCPVCNQSDQVMAMQTAYDAGVARCAPPTMPTRNISMMPYIIFSVILVGICIVLILVLIGSESNIGSIAEYILLGLTLLSIITALVLSYYAFQRVVKGDNEATLLFPAWDRATAVWRTLYYCKRDDAVFDPKNASVLTAAQVSALRSVEEGAVQTLTAHAQKQSVS